MPLFVQGLGSSTPQYTIEQADAARVAENFVFDGPKRRPVLSMLFRQTQIRSRASVLLERPNGAAVRQSFYPRSAAAADRGPTTQERMERYAREAAPLALAAARRALEAADCRAEALTDLVTVSCTGFAAPGVDVALIKQLGTAPTVGRVHVGFMGCHGALNGLRVARAMVEADPAATVLLCAVELCSLHYQYGWDSERMVANAIFSDGAAALVASSCGERRPGAWRLAASGSLLVPDSEDEMAWRIGDHGFEMRLSARVPELILGFLRPWLEGWLRAEGLKLQQIRSWAIHPGGPRILQAVAGALELSADATAASADVLAQCGNMSSPTVLVVLERLQKDAARLPCVAMAFGPGLAVEAALFV